MRPLRLKAEDKVGRFTLLQSKMRPRPGTKSTVRWWQCQCDYCGNLKWVRQGLLEKKTQSCVGCYRGPARRARLAYGPNYELTRTSWAQMKARCYYLKASNWRHYGGRGIIVCDRWRYSFANFLEDMGPRPPGTTLDRIDSNGNYEPGNCRWATPLVQTQNRRKAA